MSALYGLASHKKIPFQYFAVQNGGIYFLCVGVWHEFLCGTVAGRPRNKAPTANFDI
jgi:hypothetical protein